MLHPMRLVGLGLERSLPRARVVGDWCLLDAAPAARSPAERRRTRR
ncbi:hypothetical protein [Streptomyces sp. SCL15-6]|nr:hypothetical protein [Streptomyces sp. SCL15-6]